MSDAKQSRFVSARREAAVRRNLSSQVNRYLDTRSAADSWATSRHRVSVATQRHCEATEQQSA
ncbi:Uncharacterised protein [Clostridioides difficile]|nr:Uncharacterised protein [Clostridioides difficile]